MLVADKRAEIGFWVFGQSWPRFAKAGRIVPSMALPSPEPAKIGAIRLTYFRAMP